MHLLNDAIASIFDVLFWRHPYFWAAVAFMVLAAMTIRIADPWQRAIVLRLGRMQSMRGPGPFLLIPLIDEVTEWVDTRITTTPIQTERTLTRDATPVTVDAVVFWMVHDPVRATLEVEDYRKAVTLVSQTSLRESIGASLFAALLSERKRVDAELVQTIADKTRDWGVTIQKVEIRDVVLPAEMQNAMNAQAQATQEKEARVTLASAEVAAAEEFAKAADLYDRHPTALKILGINRIYDMSQNPATLILMPTDMVNSAGGTALPAALARTLPAKSAAA